METWLQSQAQSAGPFVAVFCLLAIGLVLAVCRKLWNQLLFERAEHRTAEKGFTDAALATADSMENLAAAVDSAVIADRPRARRRRRRRSAS